MVIDSVKDSNNFYLVNGTDYVPKNIENRDYRSVLLWIENGGVVEGEYSLSEAKTKKLLELDDYHYNALEVRILTINSYFKFSLNAEGRALIGEQIINLVQQIKLGTIQEEDASFEYYYNGSSIEVSLTQLRQIYVEMLRIVNSNFAIYKQHIHDIKNLGTVIAVESYDSTANYLKNNNIDLQ